MSLGLPTPRRSCVSLALRVVRGVEFEFSACAGAAVVAIGFASSVAAAVEFAGRNGSVGLRVCVAEAARDGARESARLEGARDGPACALGLREGFELRSG